MGAFDYSALDAKGKEAKGTLEGDNARQIRQRLREKGLTPLNVTEVSRKQEERQSKSGWSMQRGLSAGDLALITRQLATLVRSGLPVEEALSAVSQQTEKPRIASIILAIRARVLEGHSLGSAIAEFPRAFPELYQATVTAGEQSGHLDSILERLADYTENRQQMVSKISVALIYPIVLVVLAIIIVMGLMTYIVPEITKVFENNSTELPWLTSSLIMFSDLLRDYWWLLFALITAAITAFKRALRNPAFKNKVHASLLTLPFISRIVRGFNSARFARTLSILTTSGVPVLEAIKISAAVVTNLPMRAAIVAAGKKIREGQSLKRALGDSGLFPPMMIHLIASGESSGNLDEMLDRAASQQEREMDTQLSVFLGIFEPLIILIMGAIVLVIVLAILLPIFSQSQLIQ